MGEARSGEAVSEVAAELARHLRWLEAAGVREVPRPSLPVEPPAAVAHARPAGRAAEGSAPVGAAPVTHPPPGQHTPPAGTREAPSRPSAAAEKGCGSEALVQVRDALGDCRRCKLAGGRTTLVFGVGNPQAELVFVGEGPGADEDREGEPFVGKAGQLLTKMIQAMGYQREQVYIANVVKCRPPGNRNPEPDEIEACEPFLRAQLAAIRPRVVVALGKFAAQTLLRDTTPITRLRGRWREYEGIRLMPTFHPAYLLRSPEEKKKAWEDLQLVMKELGKPPPGR
ncbi:DNA polymerase [Anaeromyxobacter sp. PSR-1]|nr:DNA polymerase [Anaeromyxobacter sp. PSR-1]